MADCALGAVIFCLALAIRLPYLGDIPRLTDETAELAGALAVLDGARPLTDVDAYRGPFWSYFMAGVLHVFGAHPMVPAATAAVLGALTASATFVLARLLGGRMAGIVAGLLMATSFSHVVVNSHIAWSNNTTPLWVVLATALVWLGLAPGSGRPGGLALVASAAFWGVALHTHPSAALPLIGVGVWAMVRSSRRQRLFGRAGLAAAAVGVALMSPFIYYNLQTELGSVAAATSSSQPIAADRHPVAIAERGLELVAQLGRMAGGGVARPENEEPANWIVSATADLRNASTAAYAFALLAALWLTLVRGPRLPAAMFGVGAVGLAIITYAFQSLYDTRYLAFLLPLGYTAIGVSVVHAMRTRGVGRELAGAGVAILILYPLATLNAHYIQESAMGRTNRPMHSVTDWLAEAGAGDGRHVFVDKAMRPIKLGGGGDPTRAFSQLLTLRSVPHDLSDTDELRWFLLNDDETAYFLVIADETAAVLGSEFDLEVRDTGDGWTVLERPGMAQPIASEPPHVPAELAVVARLERQSTATSHVLVDKALRDVLVDGRSLASLFQAQLALRGVESTLADRDAMRWFLVEDPDTTFTLIAAAHTLAALAGEFDNIAPLESDRDWQVAERPARPAGQQTSGETASGHR